MKHSDRLEALRAAAAAALFAACLFVLLGAVGGVPFWELVSPIAMVRAWRPVEWSFGLDFWLIGLVGVMVVGLTIPASRVLVSHQDSEEGRVERRSMLRLLAIGTALVMLWAIGWLACPTRNAALAIWLMNTPFMRTRLADTLTIAAFVTSLILMLGVGALIVSMLRARFRRVAASR